MENINSNLNDEFQMNYDPYYESDFAGVEFLLTFSSVLKKMNICGFDKYKLNEYLFDCKKEHKYNELLSQIDFDNSKYSVELENSYSFLSMCLIMFELKNDLDGIYIDTDKINEEEIQNEFINKISIMRNLISEYYSKNKNDIMKYGSSYVDTSFIKRQNKNIYVHNKVKRMQAN